VRALTAGVLAVAVAILAQRWLPAPFLWIGLALVLGCAAAVWTSRRSGAKAFWAYLGAVAAAWALAEAHLWLDSRETGDAADIRQEGPKVVLKDPLLGWVLPVATRWTSARYDGEEPIYDVTYSTDSRGLRVSPEPAAPGGPCVLFFGGSVTFGEGVEDAETMPARVAAKSGLRVLNFGVSGYGPHQMLAGLESGRVTEIVDCEPGYVIYQGLNDHVARAAGKRSWAREGPRYEVDDHGTPVRTGRFADSPQDASLLDAALGKSLVYQRLFGGDPAVTQEDVDRYVAILRASREKLAELYPGSSLQLLQWGTRYRAELDRLREDGIEVHYVDELLPGYDDDPLPFQLSPHDRHPNAATHEQIADYVIGTMLNAP
jgi:hypothetical protein